MSINFLTHQWAKKNYLKSVFFEKITSTNDWAKSNFHKTGENFFLYLADHQSQGRGRRGRCWKDLKNGKILLSTWCFRLKQSPQPILTPLLGLALRSSLLEIREDLPLKIKPPNDLYLNKAKVGGLLVESIGQGSNSFLLIGLGLNVFDSPRLDQSTSFLAEFVKIYDDLWFSFCTNLHGAFQKALKKGLKKSLSYEDIQRLKSAINFGLSEDEKYLSVSPSGDLTNNQGTVLWTDL